MRKVLCCLTSVIAAFILIGFLTTDVQAGRCKLPEFDPSNFGSPGDNLYFYPRELNKTYVYEVETEEGLIRDYIYFSEDTEEIRDITCTVVYDVEWIYVWEEDDWFVLEETEDWYAWDNNGNVWYFGEATEAYEYNDEWEQVGPPSTEGSWRAGDYGAEPGIVMPANPLPGKCSQQEYAEDVAEDRSRVLRLNAKVNVEYGDYEDCLKIKEWTPLDPGNVEHKYYAPGVGLVFIKELKGKTVYVELVDILSGAPPDPPPTP